MPQFGRTTDGEKLAALGASLASLRTAIELNSVQHGHLPGSVQSAGVCAVGTNTDTGAPGAAAFAAHLTLFTTASGVACSGSDAATGGAVRFDPYLRSGSIPDNPMTNSNVVEAIQTGILAVLANGTDADGGWRYDFITGGFIADQPAYENR